jgi:hypothetical protein
MFLNKEVAAGRGSASERQFNAAGGNLNKTEKQDSCNESKGQ